MGFAEAEDWLKKTCRDASGPGTLTPEEIAAEFDGGRNPAVAALTLKTINNAVVAGAGGVLRDLQRISDGFENALAVTGEEHRAEREMTRALTSAVARVKADIAAGTLAEPRWNRPEIRDVLSADLSGLSDLAAGLRGAKTAETESDPAECLDVFTDLTEFIRGGYVRPQREICALDNGEPLLPRGKRVSLFGESGKGKTWVAAAMVAQVLTSGGRVVYIDLEQGAGPTVNNLKPLGVTAEHLSRFHFAEPSNWATFTGPIVNAVDYLKPDLVVLDSFGHALTMSSGESDSVDDVNTVDQAFSRPVTATGATLIALDHVTKNTANPGYALGSQAKRGNFDLALRLLSTDHPIERDHDGYVTLAVAKDREGLWSDLGPRTLDETGQIRPGVEFHLSARNEYWFTPATEHREEVGPDSRFGLVHRAVLTRVYRSAAELLPEEEPTDFDNPAWRNHAEQRELWPKSKAAVVDIIESEAAALGVEVSGRQAERLCSQWFISIGNGNAARRLPRVSLPPVEVGPVKYNDCVKPQV